MLSLMVCLKAKCSEEISSRRQEVDRIDSLIVHSPERAAQEKAIMEKKVCLHVTLVCMRHC